jgi:hypothetical protein
MTECLHCHKPLPAARPGQRYCRTSCQSAAWAKRKRQQAATQPRVEVAITLTEPPEATPPSGLSAEEVRQLVFEFHAPEPYTIDPGTGQPLWRFRELAELFAVTEFELRDVLVSRGQPFLRVSVGTSAGMLARG